MKSPAMTQVTQRATNAAPTGLRSSNLLDFASLIALGFCLLFFVEGLVFVPYLGLQNDEMLFGQAFFPPAGAGAIRLGALRIPVMVMAYVGALKAWLYQPILALFAPSVWSVRIPAVLLAALTLWLFYWLVQRTCGIRVALAAAALLATDAIFVLTSCLDWGPVVLQHFLLIAGLVLLVAFDSRPRVFSLFTAFFCFGLAFWDKAIFSWSLFGLAAAAIVTMPRLVARRFTLRNLAVAVVAFLLGAAPLIVFNLRHQFLTFRDNAQFSSEGIPGKILMMRGCLDGSGLMGYAAREDSPLQPAKPANALEEASIRLSDALDQPRRALFGYACVAAFALLPWLWNTGARRPMLFALVFFAVTWTQMLFLNRAGTGAHHVVLLWPFPHLFVGAALAWGSRALGRLGTFALILALAVLGGSNAVVLNQYLAQLVERGTPLIWTDAIDPLAASLRQRTASHVYVMDWGMLNVLGVLGDGKLPVASGTDGVAQPHLTAQDESIVSSQLEDKDALFVGHTEGNEIMTGVSARFLEFAQAAGYQKETVQVISDRNQRPVFEIYRMVRAGTGVR